MANKKITALTAITALDVADVLPVADVSIPETKKITAANLWLGGFNAHKDIDGTFAANSDLVFPTQKAAKTYVDTVLSGGQIAFPATANPSADANTLDDYEEGTWTPALYFGGYAVGITYAAGGQVGRYTKIGNRVFFDLHIALSANGSSSGQASVSLPIAAASGDTAVSIVADNMTFGGQLMALIGGSTSFLKLWDLSEAGEMAYITEADIADNAYFFISGHYKT